jgi:hypothetical protein
MDNSYEKWLFKTKYYWMFSLYNLPQMLQKIYIAIADSEFVLME